MFSNASWYRAGCVLKSIAKAKEECASENKKYEDVSHYSILGTSNVSYRCIYTANGSLYK